MNKITSKNTENTVETGKQKDILFSSGTFFFIFMASLTLFLSNYRWSKADPERNYFSAGIHASLPQATHPEGISHLSSCLTAPHTAWFWAAPRKYGDCQLFLCHPLKRSAALLLNKFRAIYSFISCKKCVLGRKPEVLKQLWWIY